MLSGRRGVLGDACFDTDKDSYEEDAENEGDYDLRRAPAGLGAFSHAVDEQEKSADAGGASPPVNPESVRARRGGVGGGTQT